MRKFAFVIAAALAVSAPTVASARGVRVDVDDGYRYQGDDHCADMNTGTTITVGTTVGTATTTAMANASQ